MKKVLIAYGILIAALLAAACGSSQPAPAAVNPQKTQPQPALPAENITATAPAESASFEPGWQRLVTFSGKESIVTPAFYVSSSNWRVTWSMESDTPQFASFNLVVRSELSDAVTGVSMYSDKSELSGELPIKERPSGYYIQVIAANLKKWSVAVEYDTRYVPDNPVQITLIQFRGTPTPFKCCSPGITEFDEYVVIKNFGNTPQDITGWTLKNITRGYPSLTFPTYFPCTPYSNDDPNEYTAYSPPTVENRFSLMKEARQGASIAPGKIEIDWTQCTPLTPLDERPMKPVPGQEGNLIPCMLNPGQTILVFTDELHCFYGGLSFNLSAGNAWDNSNPEIAVLYNAKGEEVSRRSYTITQ
jgi:hypothetical protein